MQARSIWIWIFLDLVVVLSLFLDSQIRPKILLPHHPPISPPSSRPPCLRSLLFSVFQIYLILFLTLVPGGTTISLPWLRTPSLGSWPAEPRPSLSTVSSIKLKFPSVDSKVAHVPSAGAALEHLPLTHCSALHRGPPLLPPHAMPR
ncbi:uncharacterized protein BJX67DRAFT_276166 [Aspergillus lucknowensis]|uniref:Uncharacterized protein n=1 Tax=Aspergillus lucknowensis TaxID=176173 RepID=A0ABR4LEZ3_9EURO